MTTEVLHIDFETCSAADLSLVGVHKYAEHWTTHVLMMAYRWGGAGVTSVWYFWEPFPDRVRSHVAEGRIVCAHNAAFERTLWNVCLRRPNLVRGTPAIDLPELKIGQMVCTMARAAALNLPGGLDYIAEVMSVDQRKDAEGKKLMLDYCRPATVTQTA
jgi:DNA polymerase